MMTKTIGGVTYTGINAADILSQYEAANTEPSAPLDIAQVFGLMTPTSGGGYYNKAGSAGGANLTKGALLALFSDAVETARVIAARIVETPSFTTKGTAAGFNPKTGVHTPAKPAAFKAADPEVLAAARLLLATLAADDAKA